MVLSRRSLGQSKRLRVWLYSNAEQVRSGFRIHLRDPRKALDIVLSYRLHLSGR
jgi:hypothetical protein